MIALANGGALKVDCIGANIGFSESETGDTLTGSDFWQVLLLLLFITT